MLTGGGITSKCLSFTRLFRTNYFNMVLAELNRRRISRAHSVLPEQNLSLQNRKVEQFIEKQGNDSPLKSVIQLIREKQTELKELQDLVKENAELRDIALIDSEKIQEKLNNLEDEFFSSLVAPEEQDQNDIILEVSAGVGGQEAMLFTQELFQMYHSFAQFQGWEFDVLSFDKTEIGGTRHASASISGHLVYQNLKYEGGVHRIQRVPQTEKAGRIHTSTSAVAVLPQPSEIQVVINPQDLKIETKRAGGPGGQHVNKTESAVRITHIPSGISVDSQSERSQIQNREIALRSIRARLYEIQLEEQTKQQRTARKLQVGLSSRSEKIRTYNFPSNRVTDHRIAYNVYNIKGILEGGSCLNDIVKKLLEFERNERLLQIFSE